MDYLINIHNDKWIRREDDIKNNIVLCSNLEKMLQTEKDLYEDENKTIIDLFSVKKQFEKIQDLTNQLHNKLDFYLKPYRLVGIAVGEYSIFDLLNEHMCNDYILYCQKVFKEIYLFLKRNDLFNEVYNSSYVVPAIKILSKLNKQNKYRINFHASASGKFSSTYYSIKKENRPAEIQTKENCLIYTFDFKAYEIFIAINLINNLRFKIGLSGEEEKLINLILGDTDPYTLSFMPKNRQLAKRLMLACLYGSKRDYNYWVENSNDNKFSYPAELKYLSDIVFKFYRYYLKYKIRRTNDDLLVLDNENGKIINLDGKIEKYNTIVNYYISSIANDYMMQRMIKIDGLLCNFPNSRLIMPFHDAFILEIHKDDEEMLVDKIKEIMLQSEYRLVVKIEKDKTWR